MRAAEVDDDCRDSFKLWRAREVEKFRLQYEKESIELEVAKHTEPRVTQSVPVPAQSSIPVEVPAQVPIGEEHTPPAVILVDLDFVDGARTFIEGFCPNRPHMFKDLV